MLCLFTAAYAIIADMLLLKRDTAGRNACDLFELVLTFPVAAPHSAYKARFVIGNVFKFIKIVRVKRHLSAAFESLFIKSVTHRLQKLGYFFIKLVKRNNDLFTVVTSYNNAGIVLYILRT